MCGAKTTNVFRVLLCSVVVLCMMESRRASLLCMTYGMWTSLFRGCTAREVRLTDSCSAAMLCKRRSAPHIGGMTFLDMYAPANHKAQRSGGEKKVIRNGLPYNFFIVTGSRQTRRVVGVVRTLACCAATLDDEPGDDQYLWSILQARQLEREFAIDASLVKSFGLVFRLRPEFEADLIQERLKDSDPLDIVGKFPAPTRDMRLVTRCFQVDDPDSATQACTGAIVTLSTPSPVVPRGRGSPHRRRRGSCGVWGHRLAADLATCADRGHAAPDDTLVPRYPRPFGASRGGNVDRASAIRQMCLLGLFRWV